MKHEERIHFLLSLQEHPELYSDEQLQQMLVNSPEMSELFIQLALTKQAYVKQETEEELISVEKEWEKFHSKHSAEIEAINQKGHAVAEKSLFKRLTSRIPYRFAASFIGMLFVAGMMLAGVHIIHMVSHSRQQTAQTEPSASVMANHIIPTDTLRTDTSKASPSIIFDNIPLETMLPQIATYYNKKVEFLNESSCQLRFYFVWRKENELEVTLHRLNRFESVKAKLKDNKIVVE